MFFFPDMVNKVALLHDKHAGRHIGNDITVCSCVCMGVCVGVCVGGGVHSLRYTLYTLLFPI